MRALVVGGEKRRAGWRHGRCARLEWRCSLRWERWRVGRSVERRVSLKPVFDISTRSLIVLYRNSILPCTSSRPPAHPAARHATSTCHTSALAHPQRPSTTLHRSTSAPSRSRRISPSPCARSCATDPHTSHPVRSATVFGCLAGRD